jgi:hypothetical protein
MIHKTAALVLLVPWLAAAPGFAADPAEGATARVHVR